METGEAIRKRKAVERGRQISNLTVSLVLSFVVTAAAQSERITNSGDYSLPQTTEQVTIAPGRALTTITLHSIAGSRKIEKRNGEAGMIRYGL
jgi:hypothetical protein